MKSIDANIQNALLSENGVDMVARLRVAPSLNFVDDADIDRTNVALLPAPGYDERVGFMGIPQDFVATADGVGITAYNVNGVLALSSTNTAGFIYPTYSAAQIQLLGTYTRPGLYYKVSDPTRLYIALSSSAGDVKLYVALISSILAGTAACIESVQQINPEAKIGEAVHCVDENEFITLYIDDGGVRVRYIYYYITWKSSVSDKRFMPKTISLSSGSVGSPSKDNYCLLYSGASKVGIGQSIFVYLTMPDSQSVYSIIVSESIDVTYAYAWSDPREVVPSDLSMFYITKVCLDADPGDPRNRRIRMSGQFARTENFDSGATYNLVLWSDDGINFSMDAFTLVSISRLPLMISPWMNATVHSAFNCFATTKLSNPKELNDIDPVTIPEGRIKFVQGTLGSTWQVGIANGDDAYTNTGIIGERYLAYLDIGVKVGSTYTFQPYEKCVVSSVVEKTLDGSRYLAVTLTPEGMWRLSQTTYPFYMEINSKQSAIDAINERDNLYPAPNCIGRQDSLVADFWGYSNDYGSGSSPINRATGETRYHWTGDLATTLGLSENPTVQSLPITFKIYGWSRIGLPYPDNDDADPVTNPNDTFQLMLDIIKGDGTGEKKTVAINTSYSERPYPPQTWKPGSARTNGAYPVTYVINNEASGLSVGDQIVRVGVGVTSPNRTVYVVERVESDDLICNYGSGIEQPWDLISEKTDTRIAYTGAGRSANTIDQGKPWIVACTDGASSSVTLRVTNFVTPVVNGYPVVVVDISNFKDDILNAGKFEIVATGPGFPRATKSFWKFVQKEQTIKFDSGEDQAGYGLASPTSYEDITVNIDRDPAETPTNGGYIATIKEVWWNDNGGSRFLLWSIDLATKQVDSDGNMVIPMSYSLKEFDIPSVLFSERPYNAFDFDTSADFICGGIGSIVGLVGLGSDGRNYVSAKYYKGEKITFELTRNGVTKVLSSLPYTAALNEDIKMRFTHRSGTLRAYIANTVSTWPSSPTHTYSWKQIDGPMCADADIQHVGVFGMFSTMKTRITGFRLNETTKNIGILRGAKSASITSWPASGNIIVDGVRYNYSGKTGALPSIMGPYEVRANGSLSNWSSDGAVYNGKYIDVCMFGWRYNVDYRAIYDGFLLSSDAGYCFNINDLDWKVWINQGGVTYYLKNRLRVFCDGVPSDDFKVVRSDRAYITEGFTGVTGLDADPLVHMNGAFCFLDNGNKVGVLNFTASNGGSDATVKDMLTMLCRSAGVIPTFPGDKSGTSQPITATGIRL